MSALFKKSTKTLGYRTHISLDQQTLKNILDKYDITLKTIATHPDHIYTTLFQKQQLDYKLYSAVFEIYINENPKRYLSPNYPDNDMPFNPYVSDRNQKLKLQLLEVWNSIRNEYLEKK